MKTMNKKAIGIVFAVILAVSVFAVAIPGIASESTVTTNGIGLSSSFNAKEIVGIENAKSNLSEAQKKLSTDLLQLVDGSYLPQGQNRETLELQMEDLGQFRPAGSVFPVSENSVTDDLVYVYVYLKPPAKTETIEPYVWEITDRDEANHLAVAWVGVKNLETLASLEGVRTIRTVMPPLVMAGSVTTEGDAIHRTSDVRATYSQSGSGVKVGIISDGVDNRATAQSSGDLPAGLTVLSNTIGGDEGTAMLEIVHDMVPASELYFHDCGANTVAFNGAIDALVAAGCDVICDDIGWITEPFFEDGTVASHVKSVLSSNDIIYASSAGNAAKKHYQGDYYNIPSSTHHDFSHGTTTDPYLYLYMPVGGTVRIVFQWNDQFGYSGNDYNLGLYSYGADAYVATSINTQDGDADPLEGISYTATSEGDYAIVVNKYSGIGKTLEVFIYTGNGATVYTNNINPTDSIFGHPAVPNAIAVGAIDASDPGNDDIEDFSCQGPVTISYPSTVSRSKPDLCGIDGVTVTGAGGFPSTFYGTSAAAPHIAAIAAQLWAAYPGKTGDEIRTALYSSAVDLGDSGYDHVYGYGRADALNAYNAYEAVEQPAIWVDPTGFEVTLLQNTNEDYTLEIGNDGNATLTYDITDGTITGESGTAEGENQISSSGQIKKYWDTQAAEESQVAPINPDFLEFWESPPEPVYGYIPPLMDLSHLDIIPIESAGGLATQPSSFDWRTQGKVTSVKDQNPCGTCWIFGTTSVLESAILIADNTEYDFSEQSVALCVDRSWVYMYDDSTDPCMAGGNSLRASGVFIKKGAVLELCNPYNTDGLNCDGTCVCDSCTPVKKVNGYRYVTGDKSQTSLIKDAVYNHGPVTMAFYYGDTHEHTDTTYGTVYDCAACEGTNHIVSISGWNDNVPHFETPGTGAWLVKNSWGTGWGNSGYFWLAYDSSCMTEIAYLKYEDYDSNKELYYWDEAGIVGGFGNWTDYSGWMANTFTSTQDGSLTNVDFWTTSNNAQYEIYVYLDGDISDGLQNQATSQSGTCQEFGYYSIPLTSPVSLTNSEAFTIAVKMTTASYKYPIPAEYKVTSEGKTMVDPPIQSGKSFFRHGDGESWTDGTSQGCNFCLRGKVSTGAPEGCPWLDENPKSGSVPSAGHVDITVTINTAGLSEGDYNAQIVIANNDPDENPVIIPVHLTVEPLGEDFVDVLSVDASSFPKIWAHVSVNTSAGSAGELTASDFEVYEDGVTQTIESFDVTGSGVTTAYQIDYTTTNPTEDCTDRTVNVVVHDPVAGTDSDTDKYIAPCEVSGNEVYFVPQSSGAPYGGETEVQIWVNATNVGGGQINLTYDSTCANVTNWAVNTATFPLGTWTHSADMDWITFTAMSSLTGEYKIGTLTIQCVCEDECSTTLDFVSPSKLFDPSGSEITGVTWTDGAFECGTFGICGDVAPYPGGDEVVNMGDVIRLLNHVGNPTEFPVDSWAGDCKCTGDGTINMGDVILLLNHVGNPEEFPLECC